MIIGGHTNFMLAYFQMENRLRRDIRITDETDYDYYILLNRRSMFSGFERELSRSVRPYASVQMDGVPLIQLYKK